MRILLPTDGSSSSDEAVQEVIDRPWPPGTEVKILSVAHAFPLIPEPTMMGFAAHVESAKWQRAQAQHAVEAAAERVARDAPHLKVSTETRDGSPKHVLIEEAEEWNADLIVMGSRGRSAVGRFLLGSVAQSTVLHAPCSVEIVRRDSARNDRE